MPGSPCRIRVYDEAHFGGLAVDADGDVMPEGTFRLLANVPGSLQVEGDCTAVLRDRAHLAFWPCFFPPGSYDGLAALSEHCPNLATARALAVLGDALNESDILNIVFWSEDFHINDSAVCLDADNGTWTDADLQKAETWFASNVDIYVINMNVSVDRWAKMVAEFAQQNITNYFRSPGPDARDPVVVANAKARGDIANQDFNATSPADVGQTLGHFGAWRDAMKSDKDYIIVLEDDVQLVSSFALEIWELVSRKAPSDWDFVSLFHMARPFGHCVAPHLLRAVRSPPMSPCTSLFFGWGAQGFLYRRALLPGIWELFRHRAFGGTVMDSKCRNLDQLLYGSTDTFNVYLVDDLHPLVFTNTSDSAITLELGPAP